MNGRKLCQLALALAAVTATGAAIAGRGYYHGGGYHGGGYYHGGYYHGFYPSVGVYFGPGWYGGYPYGYGYPYPYYYPPAVMAAPASPPQYIEQGPNGPVPAPGPEQSAPQTPDQAWWYHCNQPEGYYPYIHACPGGWQRVPAQPPSSSEAPESRMSS